MIMSFWVCILLAKLRIFWEICKNYVFFFKNIWLCQKKAVPLHPLLKKGTSS